MGKKLPPFKTIQCRNCGCDLVIPRASKKYLCDSCKQESVKNHFRNNIVEQKILCRNPECNNVVEVVQKKGSMTKPIIRGTTLCSYCKEHPKTVEREIRCSKCNKFMGMETLCDTYQLRKIRYAPFCEECKEKQIKEFSERTSARMKESNPMKNPEVVQKVVATFDRKIKSGELVYKHGKDHYLFKGTRQFNHDVRSHLYSRWIKPVLERDNFTCTKCGSKTNLQVHHLKPLRDICKEVFDEFELDVENTLFTREDVGDELYEKVLTKVLENHKIEYGVTLCKDCHEKEDYFYRPYLGGHKDES